MKMLELVNIKSNYIAYNKAINTTLNRGELLLIKGRNGSGKTTLIEIILKLRKAKSGQILLHSRNIGYMPQNDIILATNFPITVGDLIKLSLYSKRKTSLFPIKRETERISHVICNALAIGENLMSKKISELSGGEKQRVKFVLPILESSEILILDEPFNHVDQYSHDRIIEEILYQKNIAKSCLIIVSHAIPLSIEREVDCILNLQDENHFHRHC
jgi:ABC-type Mn2+/Zn2+ transport system ATPase subunit